ncbi:MAG: acyltransferase [Deltaproteobacteria bacterium]|nr:acyltransferase [Deltaproteobacteria bacterium]
MTRMSEAPRTRPRLPYYPALDGFRAIALSVMLLFHGGFEWASGAFLSISAFFTLSGFLITGLLVLEHEGTGTIRLASFWERRFRRLMPAAVLGLLGMSLYAAFVAAPDELMQIRGDVIAALLYVANWRFVWTDQSYARILTDPSPVQHFWSLGIEEQFYFFFPLLVLGVLRFVPGSRRGLALVLAILAAASVALMSWLHVPGEDFSRAYYGTDTRAGELFVGAILALVYAGRPLDPRRWVTIATNVAGGVALVLSVWLWVTTPEGADWFFEGGSLVYALLTAAVIVGAIRPGPLRSFLSFAPFCWVGWISYGLYVFHWPIFLWLDGERTGLSGWSLFGLRMLVTFLVAIASYRLLEVPIRSRRFVGERVGWFVAPTALASVALAIVMVSDQLYRPGFAAAEVAHAESRGTVQPPREDAFRILFVGDSVAWNMGVGAEVWLKSREDLDV